MFSLADLEKIHLALDFAQRFVRGEQYHGDKPHVLLTDFDRVMEKVRDLRHEQTLAMENDNRLANKTVYDAHGAR